MNCKKCGQPMRLLFCDDNPDTGFAFNLHNCQTCMILCKENVWENAGRLWVMPDNSVELDDKPQYYFAPCHLLEHRTVPQELIDMCGGPEAFLAMQRELRNTPMTQLPADVTDAIHAKIQRLKDEQKAK